MNRLIFPVGDKSWAKLWLEDDDVNTGITKQGGRSFKETKYVS